MRRVPSLLVAAAVLGLTAMPAGAAPLHAVAPPVVGPGASPPSGSVGAPGPTQKKSPCLKPLWTGIPLRGVPDAERALNLPEAWRFATGRGQLVAVIGTGVSHNPRLPDLRGGGDYVSTSDGTDDCDANGTFVAGIIAARPDPTGRDEFEGVAPDAGILAIRQTSAAYDPSNFDENLTGQMEGGGYGTLDTLAQAVVHAVNENATVIDISSVACWPAPHPLKDDAAVGAAVKYAYNHNVVVVASAGNVDDTGGCKENNDGSKQNDGSSWGAVKTVSSPAWWHQYVLSVGAVSPDGDPAGFSLEGPWVSVAAPGQSLVSLNTMGPGLANSTFHMDHAPDPINGAGYASGFVAGEAALVRQRFPHWTAQQVMDDIIATAHSPGNGREDSIGAGMIDPVAALTAQLPAKPVQDGAMAGRSLPVPPPPPVPDPWPRRIATVGTLICLIAAGIVTAIMAPFRRDKRRKLVEDKDY